MVSGRKRYENIYGRTFGSIVNRKTQVKNEDLPTILWRNGIKGGSVFCIVGDYMKDSTALGLSGWYDGRGICSITFIR